MGYRDKKEQRAYQLRRYHQIRGQWLQEHGPCSKCSSWENLEVHHIDPTQKASHKIWSWSKERREEELKKCEILCQKCHQKKTNENNGWGTSHDNTRYRAGCRCDVCKEAHRLAYTKENREYAAMKRATPKWLTEEQRKQMRDFMKNKPPGMEIDHIIPLRGKIVSGLHVPWNLQYLTPKANRIKANKIGGVDENLHN